MKVQNIGNNYQGNYKNNVKKQQSFGAINVTMDTRASELIAKKGRVFTDAAVNFFAELKGKVFEYPSASGEKVSSDIDLFLSGPSGEMDLDYQVTCNKQIIQHTEWMGKFQKYKIDEFKEIILHGIDNIKSNPNYIQAVDLVNFIKK